MAAIVAISSCWAQARHPRLAVLMAAVLMAAQGVDGGRSLCPGLSRVTAMTFNDRCATSYFHRSIEWFFMLPTKGSRPHLASDGLIYCGTIYVLFRTASAICAQSLRVRLTILAKKGDHPAEHV